LNRMFPEYHTSFKPIQSSHYQRQATPVTKLKVAVTTTIAQIIKWCFRRAAAVSSH
jgi:hypothetical protein